MLAVAHSAVLLGLTAVPVRVEVQLLRGVPSFELVGFAEAAVRESRVRVKSALASVGVDLSEYRVVVNLAPADVRKRGSAFDLAIALGTLAALGALPEGALGEQLLLGELSLSGGVQPLRGIIPHLLGAKQRGVTSAVVPRANQEEAALVDGVDVEVASTLEEIVLALRGEGTLARARSGGANGDASARAAGRDSVVPDLADVRGQTFARRALEIAAAGGHNILFVGPPGAGKSMLAKRLPGILPPLSREDALEVLAIESVAGLSRAPVANGRTRRFRAPHHTVSECALVGGGELARPGEVSLAHCGVLFLDELAEFRRSALEALREPLEDGVVTISRTQARASFPARPMIVAAMNGCPCGHLGADGARCDCGEAKIRQYRARVSGPVVDRLDVHVSLGPVKVEDLQQPARGEPSADVRARVEAARRVQLDRRDRGLTRAALNAHLGPRDRDRVCALDGKTAKHLAAVMRRQGLSARAYAKILCVARTIADLAGSTELRLEHVLEASGLRVLERGLGDGVGAGAASGLRAHA